FGFGDTVRQEQSTQRGRNREGCNETAGNGVPIGLGHGPEDVSFYAAQSKQRNEASNDDGGGEQDGLIYLSRGIGDDSKLASENGACPYHVHQRGAGAARVRTLAEMAEDVLH